MSLSSVTNEKLVFNPDFDAPADLSKSHIISDIAEAITLLGWEVVIHHNNLESEHGCNIYAQKGNGKIAVNVCFDAIDMAQIKGRQAAFKEAGIRGLWLLKPCDGATCAINERIDYSGNQVPIFTIMQNTGITLIHGIQYFDDGSFSREPAFHNLPLEPYPFAHFLFNKELSFKPHYDNDVFLHCAIQKKTCFKCRNDINTLSKIVYTRRIFGEFIHEDYSQSCDVRGVPETEIELINHTLSQKYNFTPVKPMFSKFTQSHYMANSCGHCGVIMGAFFESTDFYNPVVFTDMIASKLSAEECFFSDEINDGSGAWILNAESNEVDNIVNDLLDCDVIDFDENGYYPLWFSALAFPDSEDDDDYDD